MESGGVLRCLCWVILLAEVSKKGRFGYKDNELSFGYAKSEIFSREHGSGDSRQTARLSYSSGERWELNFCIRNSDWLFVTS